MGSRDDELRELAEQITEQLHAMPDGMRQGEFKLFVGPNNSGNVAGGHQVIINPARAEPDSPHVTRICPQCERRTWRFTQHCMHCNVDLFARDAADHARQVEQRKVMLAAAFGVVGLGGLFLSQFLPNGLSGWGMTVTGIALFFALMLLR